MARTERRHEVMASAPKKPAQLPAPPEPLSPAMQAWWNETRLRHSDLAEAYARTRDALIETEITRARNSNEPPNDFVSLREAERHAPPCITYERGRRLCAKGLVTVEQSRKGAPIFP